MKKLKSIKSKIYAPLFLIVVVIIWQLVSVSGLVPRFMLPGPIEVIKALVTDWKIIGQGLFITLGEAFLGMGCAVVFAFVTAVFMDRFKVIHDTLYPLAVISQTVPTIAIAPLMVLWFGFGALPKILLVFITCFFPLLVALLQGFEVSDKNILRLYRSMNASYAKILLDVKIPYALESFFSGLKISASYSIVGAVIAEWLGGEGGLGVYMTRVRKSFQFDKMFAVIIVVSLLSLMLMKLVSVIEKKSMPWKKFEKK